ncbi:hypothetical protein [Bosea sp. Root670]|uniref:hypothetical protein n=1 Tax=Bosea sp. Root670 TaxID=1736583 RepID=UPI00138F7D86|nr:hypothetical protein [Bosea sp. Root670]
MSRYPELDSLSMRACQHFDSRGQNGFGGFVRDDVCKVWGKRQGPPRSGSGADLRFFTLFGDEGSADENFYIYADA